MKKLVLLGVAVTTAFVLAQLPPVVSAQSGDDELAVVFQAAGPTIASIQGTIDAFRAALGGVNNGNGGTIAGGRREINWDGGGSVATAIAASPFNGFLNNRGARFTTPGTNFAQAPLDGLAATFNNGSYLTAFASFSPVRLFTPIDSNVTISSFFVPGTNGATPARTGSFGAVFSDVDLAGTTVQVYNLTGKVIASFNVPGSKGVAGFSFLGVQYKSARIASVRIKTGTAVPGANDTPTRDIVMMDDFLYGEPEEIAPQLVGSLVVPVQ